MCYTSSLQILVFVLFLATSKAQNETYEPEEGFVLLGDMILTEYQRRLLHPDDFNPLGKVGLENPIYQWPDKVVPIFMDRLFRDTFKEKFRKAALHINQNTCVKIVMDAFPRDHPNYVNVTKSSIRNECRASVGFLNRGGQPMILHESCQRGGIVHELVHALGFFHMHNARNRAKYVRIRYKNIKPGFKSEFDKVNQQVSMYNTPYDYLSIMHYTQYAFSIQVGKPTIVPVKNDWAANAMGQRKGLSEGDIKRINAMYRCNKRPRPRPADENKSDVDDGSDEEELFVVTDHSQIKGVNPPSEGDNLGS